LNSLKLADETAWKTDKNADTLVESSDHKVMNKLFKYLTTYMPADLRDAPQLDETINL
jgi:hypothetical protein